LDENTEYCRSIGIIQGFILDETWDINLPAQCPIGIIQSFIRLLTCGSIGILQGFIWEENIWYGYYTVQGFILDDKMGN
jgi:hypothetical protein